MRFAGGWIPERMKRMFMYQLSMEYEETVQRREEREEKETGNQLSLFEQNKLIAYADGWVP
jgi:hypothetical protein